MGIDHSILDYKKFTVASGWYPTVACVELPFTYMLEYAQHLIDTRDKRAVRLRYSTIRNRLCNIRSRHKTAGKDMLIAGIFKFFLGSEDFYLKTFSTPPCTNIFARWCGSKGKLLHTH